MTPAPDPCLGDDRLAHHRHATIRHTIPDRLDYAARLLDDALDLLARYGLAEALQPDPALYQAAVDGLRAAAGRVRAAADAIPDPSSWPSPSPVPAGRPEPHRDPGPTPR